MHWHGYVERVPLAHAATREQRLATEPDCRKSFEARILEKNHVLYEDRQSLHEIEDFLQVAVERARGGTAARRERFMRFN